MTKPVVRRWLTIALAVVVSSGAVAGRSDAKTLSGSLSPGRSARVVVSQPLRRQGEWVLRLRVSSDSEKKFRIRARRGKASSFTVVSTSTRNGLASCDAGAGSTFCEDITVPAVPTPGTWAFTAENTGTHRFNISMTVRWRAVPRT